MIQKGEVVGWYMSRVAMKKNCILVGRIVRLVIVTQQRRHQTVHCNMIAHKMIKMLTMTQQYLSPIFVMGL